MIHIDRIDAVTHERTRKSTVECFIFKQSLVFIYAKAPKSAVVKTEAGELLCRRDNKDLEKLLHLSLFLIGVL